VRVAPETWTPPSSLLGVAQLTIGSEFAGCRLEALAGRGGMGVVYRARDVALGRPVALKVIVAEHAADREFRERFEREARLAASIDHPNVVPIYGAGEAQGQPYLVMRYVDGTDLHALLRRDGPLPPRRAAAIVECVAAALDAAHAAGLVHRDVKPANVLIDGGGNVYLSDFGLTRLAASDTRITDTGRWMGSVDFSSPEQLRAERCDARSDVYALGCVLYAALTGEPPFHRGGVLATMQAHQHDPVPRPSERGAPSAFDAVLERALAKDPAARFPSAGDLGRAAVAAALDEPITEEERTVAQGSAAPAQTVVMPGPTPTVARMPPAPRRRRSRRARIAVGVLASVPLLGLSGVLAATGGGAPPAVEEVSRTESREALEAFARAYGAEDGAALTRLLTPDATRILPDESQRGRSDVVAAYRRQFSGNEVVAFDLAEVDAVGGPAGRSEARYTVRRDGAEPFSGRVVLGVVKERGRVRVRMITATPD
jgi:hypothetical protein